MPASPPCAPASKPGADAGRPESRSCERTRARRPAVRASGLPRRPLGRARRLSRGNGAGSWPKGRAQAKQGGQQLRSNCRCARRASWGATTAASTRLSSRRPRPTRCTSSPCTAPMNPFRGRIRNGRNPESRLGGRAVPVDPMRPDNRLAQARQRLYTTHRPQHFVSFCPAWSQGVPPSIPELGTMFRRTVAQIFRIALAVTFQ